MKTQGIYLAWIIVKDIKAAIDFYTNQLGLKLISFDETYVWAELSGPEGYVLGICEESLEQGMIAGTNAVFTITVDDLDEAREECLKKGITLVGEVMEVPGHVKLQTLTDTDGNTLQLVQKL
ncbi:MAG: VOC family protein [Candidatus Protochlamydia sp.]|nr:VOC family protein [Candidatus Protochlamydia sp.]